MTISKSAFSQHFSHYPPGFASLVAFLLLFSLWTGVARADVVKPALVEISVFREGHFQVELRASIEALLTGINGQYKNTTEAPTADEYDRLRELPPEELATAFEPFKGRLTEQIRLLFDGAPARIRIGEVDIEPGDYMVGDRDGLIRVPKEIVAEVAEAEDVGLRCTEELESLVRRDLVVDPPGTLP